MRILVIEDERKVASFIKRGLEEERYIVETAADGEVDAASVGVVHEGDKDVGGFVVDAVHGDVCPLPEFLFEVRKLAGFAAELKAEELGWACHKARVLVGIECLLHRHNIRRDHRLELGAEGMQSVTHRRMGVRPDRFRAYGSRRRGCCE